MYAGKLSNFSLISCLKSFLTGDRILFSCAKVSVNDYNLIGFFLDAYVDAGVSPENMVCLYVHAQLMIL